MDGVALIIRSGAGIRSAHRAIAEREAGAARTVRQTVLQVIPLDSGMPISY